jgi:hypothetical protein
VAGTGIRDEFEHEYLAPGTYRITATVESTGCDGRSVQTARSEPREVTIGDAGSGAEPAALDP